MGKIALIVIFIVFAFSFLILNPASSVLPYWITGNEDLHTLTMVIWLISIALAFVKFGLEI